MGHVGALLLAFCTAILSLCCARASSAQEMPSRFSAGRNEVMAPPSVRLDSATATRLLHSVIRARKRVRGLPGGPSELLLIRVTIATEPDPSADAVSYTDRRLIVLPATRWMSWSRAQLDRVIQHEVGHIALVEYLGLWPVPRWLGEAFAEWSSGPLSCEYETLLRLDLLRHSIADPKRVVSSKSSIHSSRLETAYLVTFLEYLDAEGDVSSGRLLKTIRRAGVDRALSELYGADLPTLEAKWWRVGMKAYQGGLPNDLNCVP